MLPLKSVIPNFVACLVFLGMAFSFIKVISSSHILTKREAAILKICPPAIITSAEVIIAEYDTILGQCSLLAEALFLVFAYGRKETSAMDRK